QLDQSLRRAIRLHLLETRQRYTRLSAPAVLDRVSAAINRRAQRIDELAHRLDRATQRRHRLAANHLPQLEARLRRHAPALRLALLRHLGPSPRVILGMDSRESGPAIAAQRTAGLTQGGATVESAGVITTPAIAYLTRTHNFSAGIVISASHNPWQDNGIK